MRVLFKLPGMHDFVLNAPRVDLFSANMYVPFVYMPHAPEVDQFSANRYVL